MIRLLSKNGKTIILASHLLDEVEKVCTHVAILQKGQLITAGNVNEVLVNEELVERIYHRAKSSDHTLTDDEILQCVEER